MRRNETDKTLQRQSVARSLFTLGRGLSSDVVFVHDLLSAALNPKLQRVGGFSNRDVDFKAFILPKGRQHVVDDLVGRGGTPNSDAESRKILRSKLGDDIFKPFLTAGAAALSEAQLRRREVEIVARDDEVGCRIELEEPYRFCNGVSAEIHERRRREEKNIFPPDPRVADFGVELTTRLVKRVAFSKLREHHIADVVTRIAVLPTGVTQAGNDFIRYFLRFL